ADDLGDLFGLGEALGRDSRQVLRALLLAELIGHICADEARGHDIGGDAAGTELPGDRPGETDQAGLRSRVVRLTGHSVETRDRGDEDDATLLRPDHPGDGALDGAEGAGEVR